MGKPKKIDKNLLYDLYYNQGLTAKEICKILDIKQPVTIYKYMNQYGFERRNTCQELKKRTMNGMDDKQFKEYLTLQYQTLSINQIAQKLNVSPITIYKYMDDYQIKRHNQKESNAIFNKGNRNSYKGGRISHGDGYIKLLCPEHPRANVYGYVLEHIIIAETKIGRYLKADEVVHHINGVKNDNRPDNLLVLTKHEHSQLHKNGSNLYKSVEQIVKEGGLNG